MDKDLDMSHGQQLTREILKRLGFKKSSFVRKKIASRYYDPETDTEVFIKYQGQNIEVGNLGFYAPSALANYNIDLPVFNIGFGVERIAMIRGGAQDLRSLVYPLTYEEVTFDDRELAALLGPSRAPEDAALRSAVAGMAAVAVEQRDTVGPAERVLYSGPVGARNADIVLFNWDQGKPLLSLAALNEIYVHDGNIYGLPRDSAALGDKYLPIYEQGINTGLRFIDLILAGFAAEAEKMARRNPPEPVEERWKIAKRPIQVNLEVPEAAYDYIQRLHKNIKVSGPLFFGLKVVWK
jgi:O-phosphoseryl-tRNA synthetase